MVPKIDSESTIEVDYGFNEFNRALTLLDILSTKKADNTGFHLSEIMEAVLNLQQKIASLRVAITRNRRDDSLTRASCEILGEIEHLRYHFRGVLPGLKAIQSYAMDETLRKQLSDRGRRKKRRKGS